MSVVYAKTGTYLIENSLKSTTCLAVLGERAGVEVLRSILEKPETSALIHQSPENAPFRADLSDSTNELQVSFVRSVTSTHVGGCKNKLLIQDPFRLRVKTSRQVQSDDLVVLDSQVATLLSLLVCDLHEETTCKSLTDVGPVFPVLKCCGHEVKVES